MKKLWYNIIARLVERTKHWQITDNLRQGFEEEMLSQCARVNALKAERSLKDSEIDRLRATVRQLETGQGQLIFDRARQELAMGLTKELESILSDMRARIAFNVTSYQRVEEPGVPRVVDFSLQIPPVQLRYAHRISMRDMAEYHRATMQG